MHSFLVKEGALENLNMETWNGKRGEEGGREGGKLVNKLGEGEGGNM
jgi:hypothetical protein